MAPIPGSVRVTGTIAPTDSTDLYASHDALYGRDGLRSVADNAERNAIPDLRRREGMLVFTQDSTTYWRLLPGPWAGNDGDWVDAGIGSAAIDTGNTLWVDDVFGDDGTAQVDRQDLPYLTIEAAVAAAASGDLIMVRPGTYTVAGNLYKAGVSIFFEQGAAISYTVTLVDDTAAPGGAFRILGYGAFTAGAADLRLIIGSGASALTFQCESIDLGSGTVANSPIATTFSAAGSLLLTARTIACARTTQPAVLVGTNGTVIITAAQSFTCTGSGGAVQMSAGTVYLTVPTLTTAAGTGLRQTGGTLYASTRTLTSAGSAFNGTGGTSYFSLGVVTAGGLNQLSQGGGTLAAVSITSTDAVNPALSIGLGAYQIAIDGDIASSGSGFSITNSTVRGYVSGSITGTSGALTASAGTVSLAVRGNITSSAAGSIGVSITGSCQFTLTDQPTIQGVIAGIAMDGTAVASIDARGVTATGGAGLRMVSGGGILALTVANQILGTSFGMTFTSGTASVRARTVSASAGNAVNVSATAVLSIVSDSVSASQDGIGMNGGQLTATLGSILSTGQAAASITGGTARVAVSGNVSASGGVSAAITVGGTADVQMSCAAISCPGNNVVAATGGTLVLRCSAITCSSVTSAAVQVSGAAVVTISCSGVITGQTYGINHAGNGLVEVQAQRITSAGTQTAVNKPSGSGTLIVRATESILGGTRGVSVNVDCTVRVDAPLIQSQDVGGFAVYVDGDTAAGCIVVVNADRIIAAEDGVYLVMGTMRLTANVIDAVSFALRSDNGGVADDVSMEAEIRDLIRSTTGTAVSILSERFILGGSAEIVAVATCATFTLEAGSKASLKCGSMTGTGVNSGCVANTGDGDLDVLVDGPLNASLRGILHTGAGNMTVRCASIAVESATARAIDASGDTGSYLAVHVAGDVISANRALYMDTAAQTEQVHIHVGGTMQGRTRVVEALADGRLYLTADALIVEDGQTGQAIFAQAVNASELRCFFTIGRLIAHGAGEACVALDGVWAQATLQYVESTGGDAIACDNGAQLDATADFVYGGSAGDGRGVFADNGSAVNITFGTIVGSGTLDGAATANGSNINLNGLSIQGAASGILVNGGAVNGFVQALSGPVGLTLSAGTVRLTCGSITPFAGASIVCDGTGGGSITLTEQAGAAVQTCVEVTATAVETITGLTIRGGTLRGGQGVVMRDAAADYRIELRDVRIVSASTPGFCLQVDGTGDFIIAGCQLVTTAGSPTSAEGNGDLKVYSGCVATKPLSGTITQLVDTVLVDADVT